MPQTPDPKPQTPKGPWTTQRLIQWTTQAFEQKGIDSPRICAEMLLAHVLNQPRLKLYMDPHRPASDLERAAFRELVERAMGNEPVDYLVGQAPFFSMLLKVGPAVLIPRPSTETLVEHVLQHHRRTPGFKSPRIADVGTGSGAIVIALAKQLIKTDPGASFIATDISADALAVAKENAAEQGVADRIDFRLGDLLEPLRGERLTYLCSNPPYIPDHEWDDVEPNVKDHEPTHALRAGADGLDCIRPLIEQAKQALADPGQLVLEIAACQKQQVIDLASEQGLRHPSVLVDHEKLPRILVADA
ncbi:MAG: peptide chain release factor N(5)-glutamine methyltransferase [Phycisphaeraceae bacterium]|nr:peptide chain release factor N(5)-glutamine methyltransferase [Phycisphaeraceae bacterium]